MAQAQAQKISTTQTVVIGRGPAAFDAARVSIRLGSKVQLIFEDFEEQAGVDSELLKESRDEGVEIHSMQALEMVGDDQGFVQGVRCRKLDIVEGKDGLKLEASMEEPAVLEAQTVIITNGGRSNDFLKQYLPQLKWDEDGSLWANADTGMTSMERVFGCGSIVTGGGSVVDAIACGKASAQKMIQYLM
jgi:NADPH-dependent glutamate synthase beta subunit-like oxidoreductase